MSEATVTVPRRGAALRSAWSNRRLRRALAAFLLFNINEWASYLALLVYAYGHGGVRSASVIALVQLVPAAVLASPLAARLGRMPSARALTLGYAAQSLTGGVVGAAVLLDLSFSVVAGLAAVCSVTITCTRPVHNALLPDISDTTGELTAGNAATGSVEAMATLLGPLVTGVLIALWSPGGVLVVMAVGALASVLLVAGLAQGPTHDVVTDQDAWAQLREVLRDPAARVLSAFVAAEYAVVGMMDILLVVLALDVLEMSAAGPGWLNAAIGVGGLLGASLTFVLIGARRLAPALVLGAVATGVPLALTGLVPALGAVLLLVAAAGAGKTFFDVTSRTLVQRLLPDRLLSAVFGVQESLMMAGLAVGSLLAPLLVESLGVGAAFALAGLLLPLAAVCGLPLLLRRDAESEVPAHVLALLLGVPIFAVLPPRLVERLARNAHPEHWPAGRAVVTEGEPGSLFYVVESGELVVSHGVDEVRRLGPGDWFGELALLRDSARTATVTAVGDVRLHAVDRDTFLTALAGTPRSRGIARDHATEHYR